MCQLASLRIPGSLTARVGNSRASKSGNRYPPCSSKIFFSAARSFLSCGASRSWCCNTISCPRGSLLVCSQSAYTR